MEKTLEEVRRELIILKLEKAKFEQQKKSVHFATETPAKESTKESTLKEPAKEAAPALKEPTLKEPTLKEPALKEPTKEKTIVHVNPAYRSKLTPEIMVF
jgi:hypothetical protein